MGFSEFILLRFGFLEVLTDRSRLFVEAFSGHLEVRSIFFLTRRGKRKGYGLTVIYLVVIQYFKKIGGKISMKLIQHENNENTEYQADSLVYKVFGLYSMQSYIGVFYHALHRNFMSLRQVLIQRLIVCQVLENLLEKSLPYLKYSYKKFRAVRLGCRILNLSSLIHF